MNKERVLTFDVETTGVPCKNQNWEKDFMEFPYIVQIAWKKADKIRKFIIKPEGYEIPEEAVVIHGITTERATKEGVFLENVLPEFIEDCLDAEKIVGHSIYFDTSTVKANVLRLIDKDPFTFSEEYKQKVIEGLDKAKRIDTMTKSISFCGIPRATGKGAKYPKLTELFKKLFPEERFDAHDALSDVIATERCYFELIKRGVINGN